MKTKRKLKKRQDKKKLENRKHKQNTKKPRKKTRKQNTCTKIKQRGILMMKRNRITEEGRKKGTGR